MSALDDLKAIKEPAIYPLRVTRGDSFRFVVVVKHQGSPIALTGFQGSSQIRKAVDSDVLLSFTVDVAQDAAGNPDTGKVTVTATGLQTALTLDGVWDLQISDGTVDGIFRKTLLRGDAEVIRDTTLP